MVTINNKNARLIALCVLGALLFNYPILSLFNHVSIIVGIPLFYLFIFIAWGLVIALIGLITRYSSFVKMRDPF
jgi:uncharacterized membrane protein YdbT with pleckstrin-like domain